MQVKLRAAWLALALLLLPGVAAAQERPWPVLERMGIAGTWAPSCAAGPSKTNTFATYYTENQGLVRCKVNHGPEGSDLNTTVDAAKQLSDTRLSMRWRVDDPRWGRQNGNVFTIVMDIINGRTRTMASTNSTGRVLIKDGVILASGQPTPLNERCGN